MILFTPLNRLAHVSNQCGFLIHPYLHRSVSEQIRLGDMSLHCFSRYKISNSNFNLNLKAILIYEPKRTKRLQHTEILRYHLIRILAWSDTRDSESDQNNPPAFIPSVPSDLVQIWYLIRVSKMLGVN